MCYVDKDADEQHMFRKAVLCVNMHTCRTELYSFNEVSVVMRSDAISFRGGRPPNQYMDAFTYMRMSASMLTVTSSSFCLPSVSAKLVGVI